MDKAKKKRIKRYLTWGAMAAVVALLTVMPLLAKNEAEADGPQASILSAAVESGSITTTLRGGGNLEDLDDEAVTIPTGVKITEFLVKNGDIVEKGQPVATVDKTSVMAAITSVSQTMEYLQEELEDGRDEKVAETIKAVPGGRVKKIFAQPGETVQEVMLRDGALAVLSIDSMMAVQIEAKAAVGTGENLDVTLADGTVISGRVESNLDGTVVVTVEDEGYAVGQTVSVEGLGTGTLYIHNAWKATGYAGTISKINAKEEQTLSADATLFTLEERDFTGQLQHRANQHREYEVLLQELLTMYQTGTIDAPCEGIVSGVDSESAHLLAAEEDTWEVSFLSNSGQPKYKIVFLSNDGSTRDTSQCKDKDDCDVKIPSGHKDSCPRGCKKDDSCGARDGEHFPECPKACIDATVRGSCNAANHNKTCIDACDEAATAEAACDANVHTQNCIKSCTSAEDEANCLSKVHYNTCIHKCTSCDEGKDCPATGKHKSDCIERCTHAEIESACDGTKHYADCIKRCKSAQSANEACPATRHKSDCYFHGVTYTATAAKVWDKGSSALIVLQEKNPITYNVEKTASGWAIIGGKLNTSLLVQNGTIPAANAGQFQKDDIILVVTGHKGDETIGPTVELYSRTPSMPTIDMDLSGLIPDMDMSALMGGLDLSGMMGGFAGFGNFGGTGTGETEALHDLEGSPLMTVTPHRTMKLAITMDEQDISKIKVGMEAMVKVEALKNREFPAEVTKVGISGTNSGGSSKFTVELTLAADSDMLPGMSATATIPLETKPDVLQIPVAALSEEDGKILVYTALNSDDGEPSAPVEVGTGVSDGENVEILSGLSLGDQVYYSYYDTLELDTSAQASRFTFG